MGAAIVAGGDARIGGDHLDVIALVVEGHKQLVKTAAAGEGGEGVDEGLTPGQRQSGGGADNVGLHDPAVDDLLGISLLYAVHRHGTHQIRLKRDDAAAGLDLFSDKTSVHLAHLNGVFFSCGCELNHG